MRAREKPPLRSVGDNGFSLTSLTSLTALIEPWNGEAT